MENENKPADAPLTPPQPEDKKDTEIKESEQGEAKEEIKQEEEKKPEINENEQKPKEEDEKKEQEINSEQAPQKAQKLELELTKSVEKNDNFSDVGSDEDDFQVKINLQKGTTTTSNFKFDINIVKQNMDSEQMSKSQSQFSRKTKSKKPPSEKDFHEDKKKEPSKSSSDKGDKGELKLEDGKNPDSSGCSEGEEAQNEQIEKSLRTTKQFLKTTNIFSIYEKIRKNFIETGKLYEDPDFPCEPTMFAEHTSIDENDFDIVFLRPKFEEDNLSFISFEPHANQHYNIEHEFKINKGFFNDKYLLGSLLMLFTKYEEFFTNLIVDYEHIEENIRAGFCGFTFFIDGEWKVITVDTRLPFNDEKEVLSKSNVQKSPYWLSLFEKAYAKAFGSYSVLNTNLLKDFLVDFTGGWSKKIVINAEDKEGIDEKKKNFYFEEISRCIAQGYLMGCMKYEEKDKNEFDENMENDNEEEEKILTNSLYTIMDIQEYEGIKLIFVSNHWEKGKYTDSFGPDDEQWEANKRMTDSLKYTVSTTDGTTWMAFEDFLRNFNTLYYCRIFPEDWAQYNIAGKWIGNTSGGAPQKEPIWYPLPRTEKGKGGITLALGKKVSAMIDTKRNTTKLNASNAKLNSSTMKKNSTLKATQLNSSNTNLLKKTGQVTGQVTGQITTLGKTVKSDTNNPSQEKISKEKKGEQVIQCNFKRNIITDTDDCFFLNPQYKIEVKEGTKMIISLMQEDQKVKQNTYMKVNFILILTNGKFSRVWDIKPTNIIKRAIDEKDDGNRREIVTKLDFNEIIKKYNLQNSKKLNKVDHVYLNLIPFIEFNEKYEIESRGKNYKVFKPYHPEAKYWLRIFSNEDIYISELKAPFECTITGNWDKETNAGGPRLLLEKNAYIENAYWPINPQYFIKFNNNVRTKIILRKKEGFSNAEESKIGVIITKPRYYDEDEKQLEEAKRNSHKRPEKEKVKLDLIQKVIKSTNKILNAKKVNYDEIFPKLAINSAETVYESSYNNGYCASILKSFNKLESPLILIPTLDTKDLEFQYEMTIFSTKKVEISQLYNCNCASLVGEWTTSNAGGSHLDIDVENAKETENNWMKNPKFLLQFDSKDWIKDLKFQVIISRSESLWKRRLSMSMINAMMSCYIFKFERERWRENCVNLDSVDFMPKNEVVICHEEEKADPKGYVLMPITYAKDVLGSFSILVRCDQPFTLTPFDEK